MKIVITGALGHIGSRLIRELPPSLEDAEIVLIDNLMTQRYASLFDLPQQGRFRFVQADVLTVDLEQLIEGANCVVHLAAITDAEASVAQKDRVEHNNFTGTQRIAAACQRSGAAMIFPSSTSVYGSQDSRVDEECPASDLVPQSPYAETKLREEDWLRSLEESEGLRFITFRFGTIVGTSPGMRFHTAVNKFCWQAVMGEPLTVWRTALHQVRPYLDLSDAIRAVYFMIEHQQFDSRVYNVVTENCTIEGIANSIREHVPGLELEMVDSPIMNQLSYEVASQRLADKGFQCQGNINHGIAETIALLRGCMTIRPNS